MNLQERIQNLRKQLAKRPDWVGTVIADGSQEWVVAQWEKVLGLYKPPYVPEFRNATGSDGRMTWPLPESHDFATMETAEKMAGLYGDADTGVTERPFQGSGGLFTCDQQEFMITVKGELKNAGQIAAYYLRNPDDVNNNADLGIRAVLGLDAPGLTIRNNRFRKSVAPPVPPV